MTWVRRQLCYLKSKISKLSLNVTKQSLYEYRDIWVEEGGQLDQNQAEWSHGNGATGTIGQRTDSGWGVVAMSFHANTHAAQSTVTVNLYNFASGSVAIANIIASITLGSSTDGGGQTNNSHKFVEFSPAIAVPDDAVLGFRTGSKTGNVSNVRVYARLRRKVGEYVSDVNIN